jgi:hypothetical protein
VTSEGALHFPPIFLFLLLSKKEKATDAQAMRVECAGAHKKKNTAHLKKKILLSPAV